MSYVYNPAVTILAWPAEVECKERRLHLTGKTTVFTSPLTRTSQTQEMPGGRWILNASFPPLDEEQQRAMRLFKAKLRGMQGYFYFPADSTVYPLPEQPAGAEVVTEGPRLAPQEAPGFLYTQGWDALPGDLLVSRGEYISYDDAEGWRHLHLVTDDCYARWDGVGELKVEPPVRGPVPVNGRLHIECPSAVFKLVGDDEGKMTLGNNGFADMSITAVEAVPPKVVVP